MAATMTPLCFLSFPPEIRNMIYRLLFICRLRIIPADRYKLGSQLLCPKRQVHNEGMSILYGDNTFQFDVENTWGPHGSAWVFYDEGLDQYGKFGGRTALPYLRRFQIHVRYTKDHRLEIIREHVRDVVKEIQALSLPSIDYLGLECDYGCYNEDDSIHWDDR
ncbi:hypothetical protein B0T14DRAFT_583360 [Immersiella caudata]|uniref:Uncharacterized protein n=1 Tax=Immersiella caudata TaxID=314043 RepID=A0AA39WZL3_9PEZI|nr:hypothetical protein B0T14DRAFT_583360 [Immersiella caudata]